MVVPFRHYGPRRRGRILEHMARSADAHRETDAFVQTRHGAAPDVGGGRTGPHRRSDRPRIQGQEPHRFWVFRWLSAHPATSGAHPGSHRRAGNGAILVSGWHESTPSPFTSTWVSNWNRVVTRRDRE